MNSAEIMQMLADIGAITINSHVVLTSGRHTATYIDKDVLYLHTELTSKLCQAMANNYDADQIDVVVGPVMGGVVICQWVAYHLDTRRSSGEILSINAQREGIGVDKRLFFNSGQEKFISGKNVLVVEDILVTGSTTRKVIELVRSWGGNVVGLGAIVNRGDIEPEDVGGVPIYALAQVGIETWTEVECPLCKQRVPINTEIGWGGRRIGTEK